MSTAFPAVGLAASITALLLSLLPASPVQGVSCSPIEVIFARGSKQKIGDDDATYFFTRLRERLPADKTIYYELGSQEHGGAKYPAVDVGFWNGNIIGAWFSAGKSYDYGDSVKKGVTELRSYLWERWPHCKDTRYIIGGYSQGAQVAREATTRLPHYIRKNIVFLSLFGDPKLSLPEGAGLNPPACQGRDYSLWRRTVPNCKTHSGSLGANDPYLSDFMKSHTGLWCNASDIVCGSSMLSIAGHSKYANPRGSIDQATHESAQRLKTAVGDRYSINDWPNPATSEIVGPDVMILLDDAARITVDGSYTTSVSKIRSIIAATAAQKGRVGLRTYSNSSGCGSQNTSPSRTFTFGELNIQSLSTLPPLNSNIPPPSCGFSSALQRAIGQVKTHTNWKPDATRIIIIITKGPGSDIPPIEMGYSSHNIRLTETTPETLATLASTQHPEEYKIWVVGDEYMQALFKDTYSSNDEIIIVNGDEIDASIEAHTNSPSQLEAYLYMTDFRATPGDELTFDASNSLAYGTTISHYEWDFNNDGIYDQSTQTPVINHAYSTPFTGTMKVRVHTVDGLTDTATASVRIGTVATIPPPAAPQNLTASWIDKNSAHIEWKPGDDSSIYWLISLNDIPLGHTAGGQFYFNIADLKNRQDNIFTIQGITSDETLGASTTITLKPWSATSSPSPPNDSTANQTKSTTSQKTENSTEPFQSFLRSSHPFPNPDPLLSPPFVSSLSTAKRPSRSNHIPPSYIGYLIGGLFLLTFVTLTKHICRRKVH